MSSQPDVINKFLIKHVEKYEELYDKTHKEYKNKSKSARWDLISLELANEEGLECSGMECKSRWEAIKNRFTKERGKLRNTPSGSGAADAVSTWALYESLKFLEAHIVPTRKRMSNKEIKLNEEEKNYENGECDEIELLDEETGGIISSNTVRLAENQNTNAEEDYLKTIMLNLSSTISENNKKRNEEDPDIKAYLQSLYFEFIKVPTHRRLACKLAILQVISEHQDQ